MPQFDLGTFIIEITWFFILFSSFYLILTYFIVPKLGVLLKVRSRRVLKLNILKTDNNLSIFKYFRHMIKKVGYFLI